MTTFEQALQRYEEASMTLALHPHSQKARNHCDRKRQALLDYVAALEARQEEPLRDPEREAATAEIMQSLEATRAKVRSGDYR